MADPLNVTSTDSTAVSAGEVQGGHAKLFLSYSRKDRSFVEHLSETLEARGQDVWVDLQDIRPSEDWLNAVHSAIEGADALVFVVSPDSVDPTSICVQEIDHAVAHNKRIIPIVCRSVDTHAIRVPETIGRLNWIPFFGAYSFALSVEKLVAAIETDLEWVKQHTRLLERAVEWDAAKRDDSFLLQKNDLAAAERWLTLGPTKEPKPTALQTQYVIDSRTSATKRQRLAFGAVSVGLVITVALAVFAWFQWQRAERELLVSRAQNLAAQAQIALTETSTGNGESDAQAGTVRPDLQRSVLLALESLRLYPGLAGDHVLRAALFHLAPDRFITELSEDQQLAGVSTNGIVLRAGDATSPAERPVDMDLLATSRDGKVVMRRSNAETDGWIFETAEIQRAADGRRVALLPHEWHIQKAAFTADGRWAVTVTGEASADAAEPSATALVGSTVRVWEVVTGREVTRFSLAASGGIEDARIDADGSWIATVTRRDTGKLVHLWPVSPDSLRRISCSVLQRNLSPSEWLTFVGEGAPQATCPGLPMISE